MGAELLVKKEHHFSKSLNAFIGRTFVLSQLQGCIFLKKKKTSGMHRCYNKSFGSNSMDNTILSHIYEFHVCKSCVRLIFM